MDGDKWRHQRKLASHEFSTRVLRDFSTIVFRKNAVKLVSHISKAATVKEVINLQVCALIVRHSDIKKKKNTSVIYLYLYFYVVYRTCS